MSHEKYSKFVRLHIYKSERFNSIEFPCFEFNEQFRNFDIFRSALDRGAVTRRKFRYNL